MDVLGLPLVDRGRRPLAHGAEAATARADVAEYHEGDLALRVAFRAVGAETLPADRVQLVLPDDGLDAGTLTDDRDGAPQPGRESLGAA